MSATTGQQMKQVLLAVIESMSSQGPGYFQSGPILAEAVKRLQIRGDTEREQGLLTLWHDLFRQGQLAWGYDINNPGPPFCHLTAQGRESLRNISRDPANADGYIAYVSSRATLNPICQSYLEEALHTFNANCFKATAVMVGCAAESLSLELRDELVSKLTSLSRSIPANLRDWRIRTILLAIQIELDAQKAGMTRALREAYEAYWPAFTQQIRTARNDAGHPSSIDPVSAETVHAALLIFPELAALSMSLKQWVVSDFS